MVTVAVVCFSYMCICIILIYMCVYHQYVLPHVYLYMYISLNTFFPGGGNGAATFRRGEPPCQSSIIGGRKTAVCARCDLSRVKLREECYCYCPGAAAGRYG